jgi:V/A-type H+/Na+-transporting ATPase subunit I
MFTERMKKIELLVLKRDMDDVLRHLGFSGCLHILSEGAAPRDLNVEEREIADLRLKMETTARFLGLKEGTPADRKEEPIGRDDLIQASHVILDSLKPIIEEEQRLLQKKLNLKQSEEELHAFAHLKVPFKELEHLTYLTFRLGAVPAEKLPELESALEKRALIVGLDKPGTIMAIAPKKGRWALDSELKKLDFKEIKFPADLKGVPADLLPSVQENLKAVEGQLAALEDQKGALRGTLGLQLAVILYNLDLDVSIDTVKQNLASTDSVQRITGWVPRRRYQDTVQGLETLTQGRIAIRVFDPEEVPEVRSGMTKVPVVYRHGPFVRSFERMVFSYSVPLYGTIDPTPFVAVLFVLLFCIMFGDVGQGFVGVLIGLLINSGRVKSFEDYRRKGFGNIFFVVGIACMVTGFLYGSLFANEKLLEPLTEWFTGAAFGKPVPHIINIQGGSKILLFFGFTIGIGAVINTIGLVINLINQLKRKRYAAAFLGKTGLTGAVFFWYVLFIAIRILMGGKMQGYDIAGIGIPLLLLFFREPLTHLIEGKRPLLSEGVFTFTVEGIVEMLESATYYVSNSVSFLRVAAFALAHTVLSSIVFLITGMVSTAPGAPFFQILIILIGNGIIIVLEGLIVTIQVVRLQYYEFFSKFFSEAGEEFRPFKLQI